jgi:putative ubiquitin-RnfH superfamily antitoxin RatB of RatAB toxin-antitoxin module
MRCSVVFALPGIRQHRWELELAEGVTVAVALEAACQRCAAQDPVLAEQIPWSSAAVGIFGEVQRRDAAVRSGDRIEIYRSLMADPKQQRRERARRRS